MAFVRTQSEGLKFDTRWLAIPAALVPLLVFAFVTGDSSHISLSEDVEAGDGDTPKGANDNPTEEEQIERDVDEIEARLNEEYIKRTESLTPQELDTLEETAENSDDAHLLWLVRMFRFNKDRLSDKGLAELGAEADALLDHANESDGL